MSVGELARHYPKEAKAQAGTGDPYMSQNQVPKLGDIGLIKTIFRLCPIFTDINETISVISYCLWYFIHPRKISHYGIYRVSSFHIDKYRGALYAAVFQWLGKDFVGLSQSCLGLWRCLLASGQADVSPVYGPVDRASAGRNAVHTEVVRRISDAMVAMALDAARVRGVMGDIIALLSLV